MKKNAIDNEITIREKELNLLFGIGFDAPDVPEDFEYLNDTRFLQEIEEHPQNAETLASRLIDTWRKDFIDRNFKGMNVKIRTTYERVAILDQTDFEILTAGISSVPTLYAFRQKIFTGVIGCKKKISDDQRKSVIPP